MTAQNRTLHVAQRQIVEIAQARRANAKIIAMDQPTSSLTPSGFEMLVAVIGRLAAHGVSIIFISLKLGEVFRVWQPANILRDGQLIARVALPEPPVMQVGTLWYLDAIAASAIGGASQMTGRAYIPGTLTSCIILGTLRNGLT